MGERAAQEEDGDTAQAALKGQYMLSDVFQTGSRRLREAGGTETGTRETEWPLLSVPRGAVSRAPGGDFTAHTASRSHAT